MEEPLIHFHKKIGYDYSKISRVVLGNRYLGVKLHQGNIGVCATLRNEINPEVCKIKQLDLGILSHRVLYNAYLNAYLNYSIKPLGYMDIFENIDFSNIRNIIMVGYFRPLVIKFISSGIQLSIFDRTEDDKRLTPYHLMNEYLKNSDLVILTSTTIFNQSFMEIVEATQPKSRVYLLGPSSIVHPDILQYPNIQGVYGAVFESHDNRILDFIKQGYGTRSFLPLGKKIYI